MRRLPPPLPPDTRRICVLGPCGAGKSTLARTLGARLDLPVIHLDAEYWQPGWQAPDPRWFDARIAALHAGEHWVMDGNFTDHLPARLDRADAVVLLDYPRRIHMARLMRRVVGTFGRVRVDMAPGCPEQIDLGFFRYTWTWRREQGPRVLAALAARPGLPLITLTHPRITRRWLALAFDRAG